MKGYAVVKNLRGKLEDIISEVPEKGVDYMLLVDVSLFQKIINQVESDDVDEDCTFIFKPSGSIRLVKKDYDNRIDSTRSPYLEDGHIVEFEAQDDDSDNA
jgi:hypothetical protein